jgi:O-antigen ligase
VSTRSSARTWGADRGLDALIVWTFVAGGLAPVLPRLVSLPGLEQIPYLHLLLFLPAVIVGGLRYLAAPQAIRSGPMIAVIAVMAVGLLWVEPSERGRGMVELALVATPLALAVLIRQRREWLLAVVVFIATSTVAAVYLFWDWLGQAERTGLNTDRYGGLYDERTVRIMEPNITATHLGFGVLLIAILWLAPAPGSAERRWRGFCTACLPVLLAGVVLSGSRGGVLSLLGAVTVLFAFTSIRRSLPLRTNVLGGLGLAAIAALLLLAPNPVSQRLAPEPSTSSAVDSTGRPAGGNNTDTTGGGSLGSFGNRTDIWRAALDASGSSRSMRLIGAGTGGAHHAVALANPHLHDARVGEHGVLRVNPHSSYLYWLVSFGVIGVGIATIALAMIALYALGNDWRHDWGAGSAMLAFFLLTSVTLIAFRLEVTSIAVSALTLGSILSPPARWAAGEVAPRWSPRMAAPSDGR